LRIYAETKTGVLLKATQKANGQESGAGRKSKLSGSRVRPLNPPKTLAELGISKTQASRWQQLAENPKAVERYLEREDGVPTTAAALSSGSHSLNTVDARALERRYAPRHGIRPTRDRSPRFIEELLSANGL
jgi:hypothetical protein